MRNYDLNVLSPDEFERLSRDLLQCELGLTLESFKPGKDQGIDARHSISDDKKVIVQSKRYSTYSSLISNLKKEAKKVALLNPDRYILTVSIGLSGKNKEEIFKIFKPFVKEESDIYGRDDLNNLLNKFSQVEKDYFKLWISSTETLTRILNNSIHTKSFFDRQDILDDVKKYVANPSLPSSEEILQKHRVVIISGIPGIGKTTLAKALCYRLLAQSESPIDFVSLRQDISEAYDVFNPQVSQLFLFDDFLGSNFLVNNLERNEDKSIIQFVERISNSKNKYLICTTREYILQQAKQKYESLNNSTLLDVAKYVVDLKNYAPMIKAKILYNHLFFSNLTLPYFNEIVTGKKYLQIINHDYFNPRVIELVTRDDFVGGVQPYEYVDKVLEYLETPEKIWRDAYESQISSLSKLVLLVLISCGAPISYDDLFDAVSRYVEVNQNSLDFDSFMFDQSLKELEKTFLQIDLEKTNLGQRNNIIKFQNPSIQDFLRFFISTHNDLVSKQILGARFLNQFFTLFSINEIEGKLKLSEDQVHLIISKIISEFDQLSLCNLVKVRFSSDDYAMLKTGNTLLEKLEYVVSQIETDTYPNLKNFVLKQFHEVKYSSINDGNIFYYLLVHRTLYETLEINIQALLVTLLDNLSTVGGLDTFFDFSEMYPDIFTGFISRDDIREQIQVIIEDDIDATLSSDCSFDDLSTFEEKVMNVLEMYGIKIGYQLATLQEEVLKKGDDEDRYFDMLQDSYEDNLYESRLAKEEESAEITSLFDSLIENK